MFLADYHTHSLYSPDSRSGISDIAGAAIRFGLTEVAITDHCDIAAEFDSKSYRKAVNEAILQFGSLIKCGIELGEANHDFVKAEAVTLNQGYDFILASLHNLKMREDFYHMSYYTPERCYPLLEMYIDELFEIVKWGKFSALGHLSYPLRYMRGREGLNVEFDRFEDKLRSLFLIMAEKGLGMEINVSGFSRGWDEPMPSVKWLRLFKECGGEIVTVGSDSHTIDTIGHFVRKGQEILKEAGFKYVCAFEKGRPRFEKID